MMFCSRKFPHRRCGEGDREYPYRVNSTSPSLLLVLDIRGSSTVKAEFIQNSDVRIITNSFLDDLTSSQSALKLQLLCLWAWWVRPRSPQTHYLSLCVSPAIPLLLHHSWRILLHFIHFWCWDLEIPSWK